MKKFACVALSLAAICMAACFSACKEDMSKTHGGPVFVSPHLSCIAFDEKKFDENNAYATVYFGDRGIDEKYYDLADTGKFFSQAYFFDSEVAGDLDVKRKISDEDLFSVMSKMASTPLYTIANDFYEQGRNYYIIHHGADPKIYFSGDYSIELAMNQETGRADSLHFCHSERVHLPKELFNKDSGAVSFAYQIALFRGEEHKAEKQSGNAYLKIEYTKKKGKITLQKTEIHCEELANYTYFGTKIDNLEK